ncbi:RNA polymerase sigma factor [Promicromonospora thailandica]|uniref:RNA polymerase sigma factor, sigma-70 family n=1 Tax=Promicromonospora thailandica TaxID=765201 RepID=A0A9X2G363_9MICO|nr:sigma-70 family RNA polymerase sigma factor [Promicromonospora thailandica]MCP2264477.1 RNA polymerase sigma factor, sigma-70 family [Promicromonospora thailandica]BFF20464.1 sigma-70 family RNA polymerase sigma factor [Promicromonospora thailandica]
MSPRASADDAARRAVEAVWRIESARIVGALTRYTRDFELAEDVAQEALAAALVAWPRDGTPRDPAAWLVATARRRAIDAYRRRAGRDERYAALAHGLAEGGVVTGGPTASGPGVLAGDPGSEPALLEPDRIDDDVLALMFVACHPVLSREARIALTLRVVGGLTTDEIARAFLVPVATVQARITRAKKTIAAAQVPFEVPGGADRATRLSSVRGVLYVIFTEGSSATSGDEWIRHDLAREAVRLARVLSRLAPEPETFGLLALLELTAARFPARTGPSGEPILLEDQDRRRWDRAAIVRGRAALRRAVGPAGMGPYALQAAIAECHAVARSVPETDWERVVVLYEALGRVAPSPVVDLNRAVAVAMARGPELGLRVVDDLVARGELAGSHLLPGVRGEMLARLGRAAEARGEYLRAAELCRSTRERAVLTAKAAALAATDG